MSKNILVTGATGNTGSALVNTLLGQGATVRALVRDPAKAEALKAAGAEIHVADLLRPETLEGAFDGIDVAYFVTWNGEDAQTQGMNFIEAARRASEAGSPVRIVRHSARGHEKSRLIVQHRALDAALAESGLPYTILRPTMFMQLTMMFADSIREQGAFYAPLRDGAVAMIDLRDIVASAVAVILGDGHEGATYDLTGPAAVTFTDVAADFSELLGRPVQFVDVPPQAAREAMTGMGMPEFLVEGYLELYEGFAEGLFSEVKPSVESLTGTAPHAFDAYAEAFGGFFGAGESAARAS
jgi:uncharacterized protein YbjT (DUF2867 family)